MKFAIYSRKSLFTGKGESVENQVEMCKQYIESKFSDVSKNDILVYEDEGFSAKNTDRPQFQKMLSDIDKKGINYIICYRLDRISRNVSDFSTLIEDLNNKKISFICIKEQFDTSTPMGRAMMYIASVFAQLERETLAERVRDNMLMLARTGRWLGGTPPLGYVSEKVEEFILDGKSKKSCKLKFNDEEIKVVKSIFDKMYELKSISAVSKYLISQNIKSRNNAYYSNLGIKEILQNPVYCIADEDARNYFIEHDSDVCFKESECSNKYGMLSYNKRSYITKNAPRNEKNEWIIAIGRHKGIIEGKKWIEIQNIIDRNKPNHENSTNEHNDYSLLSGMIFCKKCGSRMFAKSHADRKNNGKYYYICNNKIRGGVNLCDCQNLNGIQTDDIVCDYLLSYNDVDSNLYKKLKAERNKISNISKKDIIKELDSKISKLDSEANTLIETMLTSNLNELMIQKINEKTNEINEKIKALKSEKSILENLNDYNEEKQKQLDLIYSNLENFKKSFIDMPLEFKRNNIKLLIQKIEWDGETLDIFIFGE